MENRFFTQYDSTLSKLNNKSLDKFKQYQYKFAVSQLKKSDSILIMDDNEFATYADKKVKSITNVKIDFNSFNLDSKTQKFDKVFCIDKLSELRMYEQERLLDIIKSLLKANGQLIITDIHPLMSIKRFTRIISYSFEFVGEDDYITTYPEILKGTSIGYKYFKAILKLKDNKSDIVPSETKPAFPKETKRGRLK